MNNCEGLEHFPRLLRRWTKCWGVPELCDLIEYGWSPRLHRSLGVAYPERKLIRLNYLLKDSHYSSLLNEVLCHEAAHVAVFHIHGKLAVSHGPEWKQLLLLAGYEPRTSHKVNALSGPAELNLFRYEHICLVCHTKRFSKCPQLQWRCFDCQKAGLEGNLTIKSYPVEREEADV